MAARCDGSGRRGGRGTAEGGGREGGEARLQEGLLLGRGHDRVLAVGEALVAREVVAEGVDEGRQRQRLVLVEVEELPVEDRVVVLVLLLLEGVQDGGAPRPADLDHLLLALDEFELDRGAAQVEQREDEEGDVAHVHGEVEQVDQLLLRGDLRQSQGGLGLAVAREGATRREGRWGAASGSSGPEAGSRARRARSSTR